MKSFRQGRLALNIRIFSVVILLHQLGCDVNKASAYDDAGGRRVADEVIQLTLHGYNYTDRYIDQYSVNGSGGGNLFVSGPGSSGGGSVCCVRHVQGTVRRVVTIKWQSDACYYSEKSKFSLKKVDQLHSFYKQTDVVVDPKVPENPQYFEVHFYPDGHVEAAITDAVSRSRLPLPKDREDNSEFPRCPNDQKPKY